MKEDFLNMLIEKGTNDFDNKINGQWMIKGDVYS